MRIDLQGRMQLSAVLNECGLAEYKICDIQIGNDEMIHILLAGTIPQRERGMFVPTISNAHYQAVSLIVDWQDGSCLGYERTDFGVLKPNLHMIQRLNDGYLLLGARAKYNNGFPDQNALVTDRNGKVISRYCFGDGIQQCLVDRQNRIITSYFDEGVFGNYGWNSPIGSCGLILWSADGECLWQNKEYDICDCYAVNLDQQDRLWFYYYTEFKLVCTNYHYHDDIVYRPGISGSGSFLIHPQVRWLLFGAGYGKHDKYILKSVNGSSLKNGKKAVFFHNGEPVSGQHSFRGAKAVFQGQNMNLYFGEWQ